MTHVPFAAVQAAPFIKTLRSRSPLVHCITNDVVQSFTANVLLAVGACPAMITAREEVKDFVAVADALLLNVGTITSLSAESMLLAAEAAASLGKAWVLDPVAVGVLPYRAGIAQQLLRFKPAAIRGNAAEILALAGQQSAAKGPDSLDSTQSALDAAKLLAAKHGCIVAVTGETDFVTNGERTFSVQGGHVNMTLVTGVGCSLSAVVAAYLACAPDAESRLGLAAAACLAMKKAGERAAAKEAGLGSFAVALLDELSFLNESSVLEG